MKPLRISGAERLKDYAESPAYPRGADVGTLSLRPEISACIWVFIPINTRIGSDTPREARVVRSRGRAPPSPLFYPPDI